VKGTIVTEVFEWLDGERRWRVVYDHLGHGPPCLCLPAPSTISTRREMRGLADRLATVRTITCLDLPGFGESDRVPMRYRGSMQTRFLAAFLPRFQEGVDVIAAGHAASYAIEAAQALSHRLARLVLLAPTWRGPLPTAMGPHPRIWNVLESLVRSPLVGPALYALNSSRPFIHWMMRRHAYADAAHITPELLRARDFSKPHAIVGCPCASRWDRARRPSRSQRCRRLPRFLARSP
jgi:pimeloyl-ACP methyl ester carboxylesterase